MRLGREGVGKVGGTLLDCPGRSQGIDRRTILCTRDPVSPISSNQHRDTNLTTHPIALFRLPRDPSPPLFCSLAFTRPREAEKTDEPVRNSGHESRDPTCGLEVQTRREGLGRRGRRRRQLQLRERRRRRSRPLGRGRHQFQFLGRQR